MFRKNNINIGIGLGILVPMIIFGLLSSYINMTGVNIKLRTAAIISICFNMIVLHFFKKNRAAKSVQGIVLATVGLCLVWLIYFGQEIYNEW
jgi:uncharacterized membrane protein